MLQITTVTVVVHHWMQFTITMYPVIALWFVFNMKHNLY